MFSLQVVWAGKLQEEKGKISPHLEVVCATIIHLYSIAWQHLLAQCLKITEKVFFNIASEASYVYILNGQKLIKNAKNGPFWRIFEKLKLAVKQCYQTGQFFNRTIIGENAKIKKLKCDILSNFQTM